MTEAEWLDCTRPEPMLQFLRGKVSKRKLRLFACGCCRRIWRLLTHERSRRAVEAAERFADGRASKAELASFWVELDDLPFHSEQEVPSYAATYAARGSAWSAASSVPREAASEEAYSAVHSKYWDWRREEVLSAAEQGQAALLRCLFGNPFHPPPPLPDAVLAWNDGTVGRIARSIYDEQAFDRMPILADALLDAGCDNEELIQHCRTEGPHVRGCWAVDLILGKA